MTIDGHRRSAACAPVDRFGIVWESEADVASRHRGILAFGALLALALVPVHPADSHTERASTGAVRDVHDPCMVRQQGYYYIYSTGPGVPIRRSADLIHWESLGRVFQEDVPSWAQREIRGSSGIWAPDISYFNGRYHLYYSVSTFGSNRSLIGLATNATLDPKSPSYRWQDEGKVIESSRHDNYNAIDPNLLLTPGGGAVLSFGSFWSGIKLVHIERRTGKPIVGAPVQSIAERSSPDAEEAPFIVRRGGFYYLFVSFDLCCRGLDSTYNVRVGRSRSVDGPYVDRTGQPLLQGGGTSVLASQGRYIGPGHCAVLLERSGDLLVNHFYDGAANGVPTLQISPLHWDNRGWPVVEVLK